MQQELKIIVKADGTAQVIGKLDTVNAKINAVNASGAMTGFKSGMMGAVKSMLPMITTITAVTGAIKFATKALEAFNEAVMAIKEVQAVLNSTGRAAEFTTEELGALASGLQKVSNFGDEEILQGATISLLRFDSITKEMFPRVQQLVINMAKSFGGLESAARVVGISMNDPIMGMQKLRRQMGGLPPELQEIIKNLVETGQKTKAQTMLLEFMESKFNDVALAGVNVSTQLKNAWGDYLETIGGSMSAFDGIRKGLATYFTGIAADSKSLSKEQIRHIYDIQEQYAIFAHESAQRFKQLITIIGGIAVTTFGLIQDTINGVSMAIQNVGRGVLNIFNGLSSIAPRAMEAITGVSDLETAWQNLKDDFSTQNSMLAGIEVFGAETQKNIKNWIATFSNANNTIKTGTQDIHDFYEAQRKLLDIKSAAPAIGETEDMSIPAIGGGLDTTALTKAAQDYYNQMLKLNDDELQAVQKKYAEMAAQVNDFYTQNLITAEQQRAALAEIGKAETVETTKIIETQTAARQKAADDIAAINRQRVTDELEAEKQAAEIAKQLNNDKLSAQLAYLQATQPLTEATLNAQLDAYRREIEAYTELGLTKIQIDEMVAAKRKTLTDDDAKATLKDYMQLTGQLSNIVNGFANITADAKQREMDSIDEVADREKWSNDKRMAMKQEITDKYVAEEKRLKNIQKVMSMTSSVINTAEGITKALSLGPTGIPLAVLIGALGAVEIGVIAAQSFARGGLFRGIGGETDDKNLVRLSNNEYVVNAAATRQYKPVLDAINYGYKNIGKGYSGGYSDGGMVMPTQRNSYDMDYMRAVNDNITGLRNDLRTTGLELKGSDGVPLMKFIKRAETGYRTA